MATQVDTLLSEITEAIVRTADPERILLFGSRARGDAGESSDIDLIVVERGVFGPNRTRRGEAARIALACRHVAMATDVLLVTEEEFERWKTSRNHPVGRAVREGRVLYERH